MSFTWLRSVLLVLVSHSAFASGSRAADVPYLSSLGVQAWHEKGFKGAGVSVAILDNGFRGYRDRLGKAIPQHVKTKSFRNDGNLEAKDSIHGLLCAEIVHAIAPDADLLFANWEPDHPESFLQAVKWAREQGAKIVSCSIVMPGWSNGHGGGAIHNKLEPLLGNSLFFASVGNLAGRHWSGMFQNDGNHWHQWKPQKTENIIRPWGGQAVSVELTCLASSTYRLALIDDRGRAIGEEQPLAAHGSTIRFLPEVGRTYRVKVSLINGTGGEFRVIVLGAELDVATSDGCMVFPGDGNEVIAVGAVSAIGQRMPTSSIGELGTHIKPDFVAPVPVRSAIRHEWFSGTSAAAPQAAGAAALIWSRHGEDSAEAIKEALRKSCVDLGPPGPDVETGYGRIKLPVR